VPDRPKVCAQPGCGRTILQRTLCEMHRMRKRRGTPMDAPLQPRVRHLVCRVSGCEERQRCKGLCRFHYSRWWHGRDLLKPSRARRVFEYPIGVAS